MPAKRTKPARRWDDEQRLPPWVIQTLGGVLVVACFVFYFFTGEVSELLLSAAVGLIAGGSVKAVAENVWRKRTEADAGSGRGRRRSDAGSDDE